MKFIVMDNQKKESGSALLMVLVLATIFSILGMGLIYFTSVHMQNGMKRELDKQSYYSAEAGVNYAIQFVEDYELAFVEAGGSNKGKNPPSQHITTEYHVYSYVDVTLLDYTIDITKVGSNYVIVSNGGINKNNTYNSFTRIRAELATNVTSTTQRINKQKITTYSITSSVTSWVVE